MPVIQGGRWQRWLQKWFGIKGEVVASELAPEIYAVYDVSDTPLEARILEGWRSYSARTSAAAVANQNSVCALFNPANSGVIIVVEKLIASETSTFDLYVQLQRGAQFGSSTGTGVIRDTRGANVGVSIINSVGQLFQGNNLASTTVLADVPATLVSATFNVYEAIKSPAEEIVLLPNESLSIYSNSAPAAGVAMRTWFMWRERALESSETPA